MSHSLTFAPAVTKIPSGLALAVAQAVSDAYASLVAALASVMRPQAESPAEAAARLRMPAFARRGQLRG